MGAAKEGGKKSFVMGLKDKTASSLSNMLPNQMNPSKSVGVRLFLIFFIAIMFFVLTIGIISYQMAKGTIQKNAESANLQTIVQTSQKLDIVLKKYEENLQQMFLDDEMQSAIMDASLSNISDYDRFTVTNKMRTRLNGLTFSTKGILSVYMISPDNIVDDVISGNTNLTFLESVRTQPWFDEVAKTSKVMWMNVPEEKNSGSSVFRLVRSVQSVSSMKRFVLIADINLEVLNEYLKELNLGKGSEIQMLTPDNVVVGSSIDGEEGKPTGIDMSKAEGPTNSIFTKTRKANRYSQSTIRRKRQDGSW